MGLMVDRPEVYNTKKVAIINKSGTGKSTLARYLIEQTIKSETWIDNIYSNAEMYTGDMNSGKVDMNDSGKKIWNPDTYGRRVKLHKIQYMRQIKGAKDGILYLDELSKMLPARRHSTDYNLIYSELMSNIRKQNLYFIYTDQWRRGADIFIRTNVDFVLVPISPMKDNPALEYWMYEPSDVSFDFLELPPNPLTNPLLSTSIRPSIIWQFFRTKDIIPIRYDEPFKPQKFAVKLMKWFMAKNIMLSGFRMNDGRLQKYIKYYESETNRKLQRDDRDALLAYLDSIGVLKKE